jgi:hypothetical protein
MSNSQNPVARKEKLVIQEMPDEVLVYDLETNKAHCLNRTAAFVWKNCDGENSVADIVSQFEQTSGTRVQEDLIWLAIDQLNERNLLEKALPAKFAGQSRRSILKKIGLASMVALPVIASLTAPTAVMAVNCSGVVLSCLGCPDGTRCNEDGDAVIGVCAAGVCTGD